MRKLLILFAAACLLTACDKDKEADYIAQYFFGQDSKSQVTPDGPDNGHGIPPKNDNNLEIICHNIHEVAKVAGDVLLKCNSPIEAEKFFGDIRKIESVVDVWKNNQAFFVKIRDYGTIPFLFPLKEKEINVEETNQIIRQRVQTRDTDPETTLHSHIDLQKVCIVNQNYADEDRGGVRNVVDYAELILKKLGFHDTKVVNKPSLNFYKNNLFDYDIIFLITHGYYDGDHHWLFTSDEQTSQTEFDLLTSIKVWWYNYTTDEVNIGFVTEIRGGVKKVVSYSMVSEIFISKLDTKFKKFGKTILFNVACESLEGKDDADYSLANSFISKGLGCYLGYDKSDNVGAYAGLDFLGRLASGMSVKGAYYSLPNEDLFNLMEDDNKQWMARLHCYSDGFDTNSCISHPRLNDNDDSAESDDIVLNASQNLYDPIKGGSGLDMLFSSFYYEIDSSPFRYGFYLGETDNVKDAQILNKLKIGDIGCNYDGVSVSFEVSLKNKDLKPATTYHYWAYFYDGYGYCLSDMGTFTTQDRIEQVVPDEIRDRMEPYIPIYEGNNPPSVEGVFLVDPAEIVYDTTNSYNAGDQGFTPIYMKFSNQNTTKNTLDYEERDVNNAGIVVSESSGPGAFISGTGDNFSVFFSTSGVSHQETHDVTFKTSLVISGTKTSSGIKDVRYAFVVVDKKNDIDHNLMDVGEFRVFKDGDGLAKKASWPSGARGWGWGYGVRNGKITTPWSIISKKK